MSRIFWCFVFTLLLSVPLPGFNFLNQKSYAVDKSPLINGRIVDAETKANIQFATVSLFYQSDSIPTQITATDEKGEFAFSNLQTGIYTVKVHFMGFKDFSTSPLTLSERNKVLRLYPILLSIDSQLLGEVAILSNGTTPVYQPEKRTIYVENQLSGAGGTASDLLQRLPSVTQMPDGKIAIQGNSNFLVYINGKPSSMKGSELLENTSAAEIRKIELITSPSAKYDASGSGGIINLITKKSTEEGFNGNIQAGLDQLGGYSSDLLLNFKHKEFSFFTGFDRNRRRNEGDEDYVTNYLSNQTSFHQSGIQKSERINTGFRTGADYMPSKSDKISVSGNIGTFETFNHSDWQTTRTDGSQNSPLFNTATDKNDRKGNYAGTDISYEHKFKIPGRVFSFSALWNMLNYDDHFMNLINEESGTVAMSQTTYLNKDYSNCQFNTDYSTPTGKAGNLEFGYQMSFNDEEESYRSTLNIPLPPVITNQDTRFNERIQAGYGTWQYRLGKLDIKVGLRAENLNRELKSTDYTNTLKRFNLYPSLNSSLKLDSIQQILFNYTRRTDQLKTIQLDPLPRWYDFYNVMIGNPNLRNEITDKIALDYLVNLRHVSFVGEMYFYNTADKIEIIRSLYHDGIIQNRYENTGSEKTMGVEFNINWSVNNWLKIVEKLDFIDSRLDIQLEPIAQKKRYQQWYSVTNLDLTINPTLLLEVDFSYYGPAMTAQSNVDKCYLAGLNIRKTFFNKKLTCSLTGRDVLRLYRNTEHIQGVDFNQVFSTHNKFPIRFSVSYKFNHYKRDESRVAKSIITE